MSLAARRWLRPNASCAQSASVRRARGFTAFLDDLLEDVAIEREVRDDLFNLLIFLGGTIGARAAPDAQPGK